VGAPDWLRSGRWFAWAYGALALTGGILAAVVSSVDRPVNVLMALQGVHFTLAELSELGVKRVSVGSALSRAALGAFLRAAREMKEEGTFTFADEAVAYAEVSAMLNN